MLISQAVSVPLYRNYETPDVLMFGETQLKKKAAETLALGDCVTTAFLTTPQTLQLSTFL